MGLSNKSANYRRAIKINPDFDCRPEIEIYIAGIVYRNALFDIVNLTAIDLNGHQ